MGQIFYIVIKNDVCINVSLLLLLLFYVVSQIKINFYVDYQESK